MDTIGNRIKIARGKMAQVDFAEKCGISIRALQNYEQDISTPSGESLTKICTLSGLSADWLLTGMGPKHRDEPGKDGTGEYYYIPHYNVATSAGPGAMVEAEAIDKFLAFRCDWIHTTLRANPQNLFLLRVIGDSMTPVISDGDTIMVDKSQTRPLHGKIFLLLAEGCLLVKRLQVGQEGLYAVSEDHQAYSPIRLDPTHTGTKIIGRVLWFGRMV